MIPILTAKAHQWRSVPEVSRRRAVGIDVRADYCYRELGSGPEAMTDPSRWQQIEELYHAALECEPGQRAALLARASPWHFPSVYRPQSNPGPNLFELAHR